MTSKNVFFFQMRNSYLILDEYVSTDMYKSFFPYIALSCFYFCKLFPLGFLEFCLQSDLVSLLEHC